MENSDKIYQTLLEIKEDISEIKSNIKLQDMKLSHLEEKGEREISLLVKRYDNLKEEIFEGPITLHEVYKFVKEKKADARKFIWLIIATIKMFIILIFRDRLGF